MAFSSAKRFFSIGCLLFTATNYFLHAAGFDNSRSDNLAVYWGQNSYGATHGDTANWQKTLSAYCQDDTINAIPLAFLHVFFSAGGLPEIDMANTCNSNGGNVFPGTRLARCTALASDIRACQARGKIITLSLGGATGLASFASDAQARTFAETVWNLFLGGKSSTRPFGDAILDGIDLDIEGGSGKGLTAFVTRIRELAQGASKKYYLTAAPQCPFPDAYLGSVISAVGFDAVYVQYIFLIAAPNEVDRFHMIVYNNYCGVNSYTNPNAWNFGVWDNWAKKTSPNKNIKVYIGAPAAVSAAGSGYVSASTLGKIAFETRAKYSSFGGIMLWDASQAYGNNRYDKAIKSAIAVSGGGSTPTPTPTPPIPDDDDDECEAEPPSTAKPPATTSKPASTSVSKTSSVTSTTKTSSTTPQTSSTISKTLTTTPTSSTTSKVISTTPSTTPTSTKATSTTPTTPTPTPTPSTAPPTTPTPTPPSGSCGGIGSWGASTVYVGGSRASYGGRLWTAKWWTQGDIPGVGGVGVWTDDGACAQSTPPTSNPEPTSGSGGGGPGGGTDACTGIAAWSSGLTYVNGNKAVYGGRLWTARWWSYADTPGGNAGVWADSGVCSSSKRRRRRSRLFRY